MKKKIFIICIILSFIITLFVYADEVRFAKYVSFKSTYDEFTAKNVQDAIDELYESIEDCDYSDLEIETEKGETLASEIIYDVTNSNSKYKNVKENIDALYKIINYCKMPDKISSFAEDDWDVIQFAVQNNLTDKYNVGDTKCIKLDGFTTTNDNGCDNGEFAVRIANMSTPSACSTNGFSQTACGFVLEFVDIITTHYMNSSNTSSGGWASTAMRTYINSTIYDSLPEELKKIIIETFVVSGAGKNQSSPSVMDKLYLLDPRELHTSVNGADSLSSSQSRLLDYRVGVGTINCSNALNIKKLNGVETSWWARSANNGLTYTFFIGRCNNNNTYSASLNYGVSPAFRIG